MDTRSEKVEKITADFGGVGGSQQQEHTNASPKKGETRYQEKFAFPVGVGLNLHPIEYPSMGTDCAQDSKIFSC